MNARFIIFLVFLVGNLGAIWLGPLIALASFPGTVLSFWCWRDGEEIEVVERRLYYLEKKFRDMGGLKDDE
jgi:hypothetical protein